jgi:hypothetical protein
MLLSDNVAATTPRVYYAAIYYPHSGYCSKMAAATTERAQSARLNTIVLAYAYFVPKSRVHKTAMSNFATLISLTV